MQSNDKKTKSNNVEYRGKKGSMNRNRKRRTQNEDKMSDLERQLPNEKLAKPNDVSWYAKNEELLKSSASISFSNTVGLPIGFEEDENYIQTPMGVMGIYFYPHLGPSGVAVNAAKNSYYSAVVHANSRNTSYSADDLMLITLAGKDVFAAISNAVRAYGVMKTYDQRNMYLPKAIIDAMHLDFEDLQRNLSQMWFDINQLILESRQIWIPNMFPMIERGIWMNQNVYCDADGVKSQKYVFVQKRYWIYNDTLNEHGGGLEWVKNGIDPFDFGAEMGAGPLGTRGYTWSEYVGMVRKMIDALMNSTYRGIMMGDIYKAFGAENLFALNPIPSDYVLEPVYDTEVLSQIENSTAFENIYSVIAQNKNENYLYPNWDSGLTESQEIIDKKVWGMDHTILNFHFPTQPTPAEIMVATRLKTQGVIPIYSGDKLHSLAPAVCGTEVVFSYSVFYIAADHQIMHIKYDTLQRGLIMDPYQAMILSSFDWCPWILNWGPGGTIKYNMPKAEFDKISFEPKFALGDYDNYTVISNNELRKLHLTAVFSEYNVPIV